MSSFAEPFTTLPLADAERLDSVCDAFEAAWRLPAAEQPRLDDYLSPLPAELQSAALFELLPIELAYMQRRGWPICAAEYCLRYPAAEPYLQQWLVQRVADESIRQLAPGERFAKYTIVAWLGAGGMGDVYRAVDPALDREVAIKILLRRFQWSSEALARIQVEARALAALNHPHIVTVYEFATHQEFAYMALELLTGQTLAARLEQGPLTTAEALRLAIQLARAMAAAHDKQIVHRDLKPQNIFLLSSGEPKILDFGLARLAQSPDQPAVAPTAETAACQDTATGTRLGTTGYMSPEQIRGEPADAKSDVFAFGCVLHEMLFAKHPFRRPRAAETDAAILHEPPQSPAARDATAKALAAVCRRCLQKPPAERFASAAELAGELTKIQQRQERSKGLLFRRSERLLLAALCVVLVAVGARLWQRARWTSQRNARLAEIAELSLEQLDQVKACIHEINCLGEKLGLKAPALSATGSIQPTERYLCVAGYLSLERGTRTEIDQAIGRFHEALGVHPDYVPALVGLGESHYALSNAYASPREEMDLVRDYAQRASKLGDSSGTAQVLLGTYAHRFAWDWETAARHFEAALQTQPNSVTALHMYGNALVLRKDFAAGISKLKQALRQDQDSLELRTDLALAYLYCGMDSEANNELQEILKADANFFPARWAFGELYLRKGDYRRAVVQLEQACKLDKENVEAQAELAFCLGKDGQRDRARAMIASLQALQSKRHVPPTALAVAQLGLASSDGGQYDQAVANLRLGVDEHDEWLVWLAVDPVFRELRPADLREVQAALHGALPVDPE